MERRNFLKKSALAGLALTGAGAVLGKTKNLPTEGEQTVHQKEGALGKPILRIGICADLHQDIIYDGPRRLTAFIEEMNQLKPDFIIQLGDFCIPKPSNQVILDIWNRFKGPKYHVIGNHDIDGGYTHEQVVAFWNAAGKYYSFDKNGYHFIILNGNEKGTGYSGYPRSILEEQQRWLEKDIEATKLPVIVFCHQAIDNDAGGIYEGILIRALFDRANQKAGFNKVQLVFSGHHHQDWCNLYNNIHYVQINSMSYQWMGSKYARIRFDDAVEKAHGALKYTAPYKDPLWAFVTIYPGGACDIKGRQSVFIPPTPEQMNRPPFHGGYPDVPYISDRRIQLQK